MVVKVDRKLDCLGLYCPEPVSRTRMELDEMQAGETLEVLTDDPAAESDITSLIVQKTISLKSSSYSRRKLDLKTEKHTRLMTE